MDRDIPSFNRAVMQRIYAKNHQLHLKRLKNIKSGISSSHKSYQKSKPSYLPHSNSIVDTNYQIKLPQYNNVKKQVIQQSKNAEIQRQNALLFQKMMKIMKRPDKNNDPTSNRQRQSINVAKQRLSMQYTKINEENRAFYHRLQHQKPTIDNKKLQQQRVKNLNILKFLGKYPNHQARARASQYKTFDLRSRRMNSTSNRVYYNNQGLNNYEQDLDENGEQSLIKFRNQMVEYDRHMQKLKMQQQKNGLGQNKVNSTTANFYNYNRKKQSLSRQNGKYTHVNSNQLSEIQMYEPVIPSRRKFISQGQSRNASYQQQNLGMNQMHFYDKNEIGTNNDKNHGQQQQQLYPYHLNHPSHNIVIQDQNIYNMNKKKKQSIQTSRIPDQSDTNRTNFGKPLIAQQRKLNSKNSQKSLLPSEHNQNQNNANIGQKQTYASQYKPFMRGNDNMESQPVPRFAKSNNNNINKNNNINNNNNNNNNNNKSNSSIGNNINKNYTNNNIINPQQTNNNINKNNNKDFHNNNNKQNNNQNIILLYKNIVQLNILLLQQQKQQLFKDIQQQLVRKYNIDSNNDRRLFDEILVKYFNCQISIYRLFDCYKISVQVDDGKRFGVVNKKRSVNNNRMQQSSGNNNDNNQNILINTSKQIVQKIRECIMQRLDHVCEVQIPQTQGSLLLQEIDYDYKEFIKEMVKIQKDLIVQNFNVNNSHNDNYNNDNDNNGQQYQQEHQQQDQSNNGYRLVIVLNSKSYQKNIENDNNKQQHNNQGRQIVSKASLQTPIQTSKSIQRNSQSLINTNTINRQSRQQHIKQYKQQSNVQIGKLQSMMVMEKQQNEKNNKGGDRMKQINSFDLLNNQQRMEKQNNQQPIKLQQQEQFDSIKKLNSQQKQQQQQQHQYHVQNEYHHNSNQLEVLNNNLNKQQQKQKELQQQDQQQQEQKQQDQQQLEQQQKPDLTQSNKPNQIYIQALDQQLL